MILPSLRDLFDLAARHTAFEPALARLRRTDRQVVHLAGLNPTAKALYTVLLYKHTDRSIVLIVESNPVAETMAETLGAFFELLEISPHRQAPFVLPAHDVLPYDGLSPHADISEKRGIALWRMAEGDASIVVAPVRSALLKVAGDQVLRNLAWKLETGDEFFLEDLETGLWSAGYERREPVEMEGQFSVRGGIIDIYSPESAYPVRIEMFGEQIESIRFFDPETQKSVQTIDEVRLLPLTEYPAPLFSGGGTVSSGAQKSEGSPEEPVISAPGWEFDIPAASQRSNSILETLDHPLVIWSERAAIDKQAKQLWESLGAAFASHETVAEPGRFYWTPAELSESAAACSELHLEELSLEQEESLHIPTQPAPKFHGNIPHFVRELEAQVKAGKRALIAAQSPGDVERLADVLGEHGLSFQLSLRDRSKTTTPYLAERAYLAGPVSSVLVVETPLRAGAVLPDCGVILYGHEDLFSASELVARPEKRKRAMAAFLSDLQDLKEGDLIVHAEHGVGRYLGLRQIEQGGRNEDLMLIGYADNARLYLPLSRLDLVHKYHGAGGRPPAVDRLGGQTWSRAKSRVRAKLAGMADELLKLYAERRKAPGFAFSPDSDWQREFEQTFEYTETPDQLTAIGDIKQDMEARRPMDRLICGDVGFGKTEVAMRAAFKVLGDGKQVAMLAPTTILALQHYETFRQRFAAFPMEIEMLTRFRSPKERKAIIARITAGKIDIVIGTHRLLSKDVVFSDLGLLIVDEEQRFGVRHKERLKQIAKNVDVLTLTATPIPRTLHMSLVGVRDISVIQTPPRDRLAIQTVVALRTDDTVRGAIEREIARGGQTYYIYNRVESIWQVAAHLQKLVPSARIAVGHGQLAEKDLEKVILKFMRHECDVLLATTIVENGLDIPLANTILIQNADRYGLAEMYQLRGRVGRSNRRAYAYLLVERDQELSSAARKRLAALKEFCELGSGFKIAALDLELRGGGNLLGAQQHGQIGAVGFETYCRMLEEEVRRLGGEEVEERVRTTLRLQMDLHIPPDYISDETQRLQTYKRLAQVETEEQRERMRAELRDRYGTLPEAVETLMGYSLIKYLAEKMRMESIERRRNQWRLRFREDSKVNTGELMRLVATTAGANFSPKGELAWPLGPGEDVIPAAALDHLKGLLARLAPPPAADPENAPKQ